MGASPRRALFYSFSQHEHSLAEQDTPVFQIQRVYLKDLSLEQPNSPAILLEQQQPSVDIQLAVQAENVADGIFEICVVATVQTKIEDKTVFLVEVAQGGIFQIRNVPTEELEPIMMIGCANILFPYAREVISDAITRAGFQPVILAPVNFEALYQQNRQQQAASVQ